LQGNISLTSVSHLSQLSGELTRFSRCFDQDDRAFQFRAQRHRHRERLDRPEAAVSRIRRLWVRERAAERGYTRSFLFFHSCPLLTVEQEAQNAANALKRCMSEMEAYTDPMNVPINIDGCGGVMDAVSEPFTQECACSKRTSLNADAGYRLNGKRVCMNVYDVRLVDDWPACGMNWPPDLPDVYTFLRVCDPRFPSRTQLSPFSATMLLPPFMPPRKKQHGSSVITE